MMPKRRRRSRRSKTTVSTYILTALLLIVFIVAFPTKGGKNGVPEIINRAGSMFKGDSSNQIATPKTDAATDQLVNLKYKGEQIVTVNNNKPTFSKADLSLNKGSWQRYGNLDAMNRVTAANALIGKDLMPKDKRERLYISPTGYHNKKIQINGHQDWLYNRCHLIGYQLTGQNNNIKNLMTGTRSLNDPGMTKYENPVANYIKDTGHHVRYQVTPVFRGSDQVAQGVHMQAQSVEDSTIHYNVYIFNIQSGITINYTNGRSVAA